MNRRNNKTVTLDITAKEGRALNDFVLIGCLFSSEVATIRRVAKKILKQMGKEKA